MLDLLPLAEDIKKKYKDIVVVFDPRRSVIQVTGGHNTKSGVYIPINYDISRRETWEEFVEPELKNILSS